MPGYHNTIEKIKITRVPCPHLCGHAFLLAILITSALCAEPLKLEDSLEHFRTGQYAQCLQDSRQAVTDFRWSKNWRVLYLKSLLAVGEYEKALTAAEEILQRFPLSMELSRLGYEIYLANDKTEKAADTLKRIHRYAQSTNINYWDSNDIVALGEVLLLLGAEPRTVLESFFNQTLQKDPDCREAYLAAGNLALNKYDYELAGDLFQNALKRMNDDPDLQFGLAQAFLASDRKVTIQALDAALTINPNHIPSLLLRAEHLIDAEEYDDAQKTLQRVLKINPARPEAWAFRALIAYLENDPGKIKEFRTKALKFRPQNPLVDHLIGKKLSQKYRFADGAKYQQQALKFDPEFLPAKMQLAQDMLRLGTEEQGWQLAQTIYEKDAYNVEAYNLVTLNDSMSKFQTLRTDDFIVRMSPSEALVFGDLVLELLQEVKTNLCEKYGLKLKKPVTIELFDQQQDFAVRTFGMPGGDGFLGVCFGDVITMNSPKPSRPSNWRAVLWHEFCHVVTLNLTHNKMPRWLSEGISVYEEAQKNPTWGQHMNPQYRLMILEDQLTPIGKLSGAFLAPPTPMHLEFAYYESSLVVEYIISKYGLDKLKAILVDLGKGDSINQAIEKHTEKLETLETEFTQFITQRAENLAPKLDWEIPDDQTDPNGVDPSPAEWLKKHPNSFWALTLRSQQLIARKNWDQAKIPLQKLIELYPEYVEQDNPYELLALVHRQLNENDLEVQALEKLASRSADALAAYERLVQQAAQKKDWHAVVENGRRYIAVNPLLGKIHNHLGNAYEALDQEQQAIKSYQRLLHLDPADPVDVHYRLACLLKESSPDQARKHVLLALADAPRFRDAHKLLLELTNKEKR
jgi:tetratricopeptide (TPR) repeat protein